MRATIHTQPSRFPLYHRETGELLAHDERCQCGHLSSEHRDTVAYGHGACARCACDQFSWAAFVRRAVDGSAAARRAVRDALRGFHNRHED